MFLAVVLAC